MDVLMRFCLPNARQICKDGEQKYKKLVSQQDLLIHYSIVTLFWRKVNIH